MKRCTRCGANVKNNCSFCPHCGTPLVQEEPVRQPVDRKILLIASLLLLLAAVCAGVFFLRSGATTTGSTAPTPTEIRVTAFSDNPAAISEVSLSVVKLSCYDKNGDLFGTGSGFACFADHVIVTNYHVIEGEVYHIEASTESGLTFAVPFVLATDEARDIALLATASPHGLAPLPLGSSEAMQKGEKVVAIGSPLGLLNSVSSGVFSGYVAEDGMDVLQFTAAISGGSSGGALFSNRGEVLGITYASYEGGQNLNLAVPIELAAQLYHENADREPETVAAFHDRQIRTVSLGDILQDPEAYRGEALCVEAYISTIAWFVFDDHARSDIYLVPESADVWGHLFLEEHTDSDYETMFAEDERMVRFESAYLHFDTRTPQIEDYLPQAQPGDHVILTCEVDIRTDRMDYLQFQSEFSYVLLRATAIEKAPS